LGALSFLGAPTPLGATLHLPFTTSPFPSALEILPVPYFGGVPRSHLPAFPCHTPTCLGAIPALRLLQSALCRLPSRAFVHRLTTFPKFSCSLTTFWLPRFAYHYFPVLPLLPSRLVNIFASGLRAFFHVYSCGLDYPLHHCIPHACCAAGSAFPYIAPRWVTLFTRSYPVHLRPCWFPVPRHCATVCLCSPRLRCYFAQHHHASWAGHAHATVSPW